MHVYLLYAQSTVEVRYIRDRSEQLRILQASRIEPTVGHMGIKRTCIVSMRGSYGMDSSKDVEEMVCVILITVIIMFIE